jgi:hypothetical protein
MNMQTQRRLVRGAAAALVAAGIAAGAPAIAHHSFALYNMEQTLTFTGVVTRVNPDANHLQIFFAPMNAERKNVERGEDGKPLVWAVEMTGSAQAAADGISVGTFPPGTIFSVGMHPLRSGEKPGEDAAGGRQALRQRGRPRDDRRRAVAAGCAGEVTRR